MTADSQAETKRDNRWFAVELNNRAWDLLAVAHRSDDENREMIAAAFASWYHWSQAGTAVNVARADGTVSRAAAAVGDGQLALRYADHYYEACLAGIGCADWDLAFARAAQARAHAALGDQAQYDEYSRMTREAVALVQDPEERAVLDEDMKLEPWPIR